MTESQVKQALKDMGYEDLEIEEELDDNSILPVNEISTSKQMIKFYRDTFNPVTESMEGAALHYVCLMEKIPFLQIRSISNYIGERNKKKWNMQESINNLNENLKRIINNY